MLRKQALIAVTALGLSLGSGAALAMPVGLQGLAHTAPVAQERGALAQPVHYRTRRHVYVHRYHAPRRHVLVHPRFHKRHFVRRHHFAHPHVVVRRHHYGYPYYYYHTRPRVSFGLSFGW